MTLGEKIRYQRLENNLSQEKLANLLQTSRQTIYHWENNITIPNINDIKKLSQSLNVHYDYFLNDVDDGKIDTVDEVVGDIYKGVKRHWRKIYINFFIGGSLFTGMGLLIRVISGLFFPSMTPPDGFPANSISMNPGAIFKTFSNFVIGVGAVLLVIGIVLLIKDYQKQKQYH